MLTGVVKWFNDAKGFGFIEHTNGQDVFVHYSVIEWEGFKTLKDGEQVQYELKEGEKGLHAAKVTRPNAKLSEAEKEAKKAGSLSSQIEVENEAQQQPQASIFKNRSEDSKSKLDFSEQ